MTGRANIRSAARLVIGLLALRKNEKQRRYESKKKEN